MAWVAPDAARASGPVIANLMAEELDWSMERKQLELRALMQDLDRGKLSSSDPALSENSNLLLVPG